ncbi:MAG TPA: hypothetical protein G4O16_09230 [Dehalococcoidia bacterium]|nr:hypothetical protein [Dehalococcoidia bacterium]
MQWELIVILVIAIPVILFPAAYVWYINIGGLTNIFKEAREKRAARAGKTDINNTVKQELEYEKALTETLKKYPW